MNPGAGAFAAAFEQRVICRRPGDVSYPRSGRHAVSGRHVSIGVSSRLAHSAKEASYMRTRS